MLNDVQLRNLSPVSNIQSRHIPPFQWEILMNIASLCKYAHPIVTMEFIFYALLITCFGRGLESKVAKLLHQHKPPP